MNPGKIALLFLCIICAPFAWSTVFVEWSSTTLPTARSLGINDIVLSWGPGISASRVAAARKQGYNVYVEPPLEQATPAAKACAKTRCAGIILNARESESADTDKFLASLRSAYPKLRFLVLNPNGKQPEMKGSLIIKRDSVLEVSSPTAQPWIDTNLALVKVEQRSRNQQAPLYTFSWSEDGQQRNLTADDYSLAVAEAGAFHADLLLRLDAHLQEALNSRNSEAWALWGEVGSMLKFSSRESVSGLVPAANVAVIVDNLDTSDEVLNLLSRHNIPFQIFLPADLKTHPLKGFDIVIVYAKTDSGIGEQISGLAADGATVVVVDAHGKYPWQGPQAIQVNEHTTSYAVGNGKVLELAEAVTDPETFAQDIRRLLGKQNSLLSLWNGLTTIAVPYKDDSGALKLLEFVNYADDPLGIQVQVKGSFATVRYETPERGCCQSIEPVRHDGFTEFVIPELRITGRVYLESR